MEDKVEDGSIEIYSTKRQMENFKKSIQWLDIKRELEVWSKGFEVESRCIVDDAASTNPSTASVLLHMGDLNGRMKAISYVLSLPDLFLNILEEKKNDTSDK